MNALPDVLWRSVALLAVGAVLLPVLRSRIAQVKHLSCCGLLYALLLLPITRFAVPTMRQPAVSIGRVEQILIPTHVSGLRSHEPSPTMRVVTTSARARAPFPWAITAAWLYVAVAFALICRLLLGVWRVNRLVKESEPLSDAAVRELAHEVWLQSLGSYQPPVHN